MSEIEMKSNALNTDAYAFIVLQRQYRDEMGRHACYRANMADLRDELDRMEAKALTAAERATSIMETLLKLQQPLDRDAALTHQTAEERDNG